MSKIRISCAALVRILHKDKYFLIKNKNRSSADLQVYAPVGGALEFYKEELLNQFSAKKEKENKNDLRWFLPEEKLAEFREWFKGSQDRETDPRREMTEELAIENRLFKEEELDSCSFEHLRSYTSTEPTNSQRKINGIAINFPTYYFFEIFTLLPSAAFSQKLELLAREANEAFILLPPRQIKEQSNKENKGIKIAETALHLLP